VEVEVEVEVDVKVTVRVTVEVEVEVEVEVDVDVKVTVEVEVEVEVQVEVEVEVEMVSSRQESGSWLFSVKRSPRKLCSKMGFLKNRRANKEAHHSGGDWSHSSPRCPASVGISISRSASRNLARTVATLLPWPTGNRANSNPSMPKTSRRCC
jgi:hypothetical protein